MSNKTLFTVSFYHSSDDTEPFARLPIEAKMPLGALVFAMHRAHLVEAGYALVSWDGGEREFYRVRLDRERIHFDRIVEQEQ